MPFNYWDIDEIICEEQRVTCETKVPISDAGFLDPETRNEDLEEQVKVDLPLWMAQALKSRHIVEIEMPIMYSGDILKHLQQDAVIQDLRMRSPFYYEVGMKLAYLLDDKYLQMLLLSTLGKRWRQIVRVLGNMVMGVQDPPAQLLARLTFLEERMIYGGREADIMFKKWMETFGYSVIDPALTAGVSVKRRRLT